MSEQLPIDDIKDKARIYWKVGRYEQAEKYLRSIIDRYGRKPQLLGLLARSMHVQSKFQGAIGLFLEAIKIDSAQHDLALALAATLADVGRYEEANEIFEFLKGQLAHRDKLQFTVNNISRLHYEIGESYKSAGLLVEAAHEYRRALSLQPAFWKARLSLAKLYMNMGEYKKAETELLAGIDVKEERAEVYAWLAVVNTYLGDSVRAEENWQKAVDLNPDESLSRALHHASEIQSKMPLQSKIALTEKILKGEAVNESGTL